MTKALYISFKAEKESLVAGGVNQRIPYDRTAR